MSSDDGRIELLIDICLMPGAETLRSIVQLGAAKVATAIAST